MYTKEAIQKFADSVFEGYKAVTTDGVGMEDLDEGMAIITSLKDAADDFKANPQAAGFHLAARLADRFGDEAVASQTAEG